MAKDDETGVEPVSKDGEGADDNVKPLRGGGSAKERAAALAAEQEALDTEDAAAGTGEEDDGQLFVWEQGRKITLGTLIARGTPIEHAFVFGGKRLKGRGQLMGFDEDSLIVGRGLVSKTSVVPTRDGDEKVTKATIETHLSMKVIVPADSDEAEGMLAAVLDRRGYTRSAEAA